LKNKVTPRDIDKGKFSKIDEIVQQQIIDDYADKSDNEGGTFRGGDRTSRSPDSINKTQRDQINY